MQKENWKQGKPAGLLVGLIRSSGKTYQLKELKPIFRSLTVEGDDGVQKIKLCRFGLGRMKRGHQRRQCPSSNALAGLIIVEGAKRLSPFTQSQRQWKILPERTRINAAVIRSSHRNCGERSKDCGNEIAPATLEQSKVHHSGKKQMKRMH